jgi:hypothetical protein
MRLHLLLGFLCHVVLLVGSFGYGNAGHQAVATIAERQLAGTRAETEIRALLHENEDLARASTWADRAKFDDKYLTKEMKEFVAQNPGHHGYHYCDIPFQEKTYRNGMTGTNDRDIVHTLRICIATLQKSDDLSDNLLKIDKRIALLLLVHYLGDLHQPLHVGCSYLDENDRFVNPETGASGQGDNGGNCFRLTTRTSLHGYWDTQTVKAARDHAGTEDFSTWLVASQPPQPDWKASGPLVTWPEQWASDTLLLSPRCFEGITLGPRFLVPTDEKHDAHFEWKVTLDREYADKSRDIVERQLSKAGYRLAELLKAIWP